MAGLIVRLSMPWRSSSRLVTRPSNLRSNATLRPTYSANSNRTTPAVCESGLATRLGGLPSAASAVGPVSLRNADTVARRFDQALSWVSTTPLGSPVEPDVSSTSAGRSPTSAAGGAWAAASAAVSGSSRAGNRARPTNGTAPAAGSSGSPITSRAPMAATTRATSSAGAAGCIATTAASRHHTAAAAGRNRSSLPTRTTTRSPGPTAPSRRPSRTEAAASWA